MRMFKSLTDPPLITTLNNGGVLVIPTDTTYGVVARASDQVAVERVYRVRGRAPQKPCVVLVAGDWQINDTSLWLPAHWQLARGYWPGPLSLVAPVSAVPKYLHRDTHTLAYRVPRHEPLRKLLSATGPLVAPSANTEGQPPATTLDEAYSYFGDNIDGYVQGGTLQGRAPSTVAGVIGGKLHIYRQGALRITLPPPKHTR